MSSGTEKISITLPPGMSNQEIKTSLISIYDKINKPPTKEVGYDLFLKLVHKNLYYSSQMNFIINHVGEFISPLEPKEKDPCIKLLSLIFYTPSSEEESIDTKIYFPYLSPVLTIMQNLIKDSNSSIFPTISNIFAEIVQNIMPTDIEASNVELDPEEKTAYEMLQGFCIYNMKYDDKSNRIVGSLCLTKLVENCPVVLQKQYMKLIWEVIISLIDKKNFNAKNELLNCLISLILGAENLFMPYAHNTLFKVLDFLDDTDWLKRKLALNIIYTLIIYCKEEILPLKEHIISFLRTLKTDKIKEVREVCLLILKIFSENEQKNKEKENKDKNKANNNNFNMKKKIGNKAIDNKKEKNKKIINNNSNINAKNPNQKKPGNKILKNNDLDKNSNNFNKFGECITPEMRNKDNIRPSENMNQVNSSSNSFANTKEKNKDNEDNTEKEKYQEDKNDKNKFSSTMNNNKGNTMNIVISDQDNSLGTNNFFPKKAGLNSTLKTNSEKNNDNNTSNQVKFVNRKDDNTFINEKMVIKPDPNKSIFKSLPNSAFFNQAKKSKDIVLVSKGDPSKYKNNINKENANNNNEKKDEIVIKIKEPKPIADKNVNDAKKENTEVKEDKELISNKEKVEKEEKTKNVKKEDNNIGININKEENSEKKNININIGNNEKEKENNISSTKNKIAPIKRAKFPKKNSEKKSNNINIKKAPEKHIDAEEIEEKNIIINDKEDKKEQDDKDKDIEIKNYKTFLDKNEDNKNKIDKKEIEYDPNLINTLLLQMNSLSQKQLSLIDVMDNIQMETQGQIKQLNKRISKLEKNVEDLNKELYYLKNE